MDFNNSDTDSSDVFEGPITKREIVARLKYYKILSDEYLEPLSDLKNSDVVDEDLVAFYWNIFTSRENMACSENPARNKSIYQNLEQRKSLYNAETVEQDVSIRRYNTPAESFVTDKSEAQSESFNDSLNTNRDSLQEPDYCEDEQSIITISDDSYISNGMENETLEEIQIKLEDITNDEIENHDIEKQIINTFKINEMEMHHSKIINEIPNVDKSNTLENDEMEMHHSNHSKIINEISNADKSNTLENDEMEIHYSNHSKMINEISNAYKLNTLENDEMEMHHSNHSEIINEISNADKSNTLEYNEMEMHHSKIIKGTLDNDKMHDIEIQLLNTLKINEIPKIDEPKNQNAEPVETSILTDTFITKNSDLENYCPVSSPSFHEQYDDSFNDTLEDMEMLMKLGENYMKQNEETVYRATSVSSSSRSNISEGFNETNEIYEKISKQTNTPTTSKYVTKNQPHTPSTKDKKIANTPMPKTPSVLKSDNTIKTPFKIPTKAPPSARKSPNYKSIVSPISLYIKNSPKVPLIKNINTPTMHSATYRELDNTKKSYEKSQEQAIPNHSILPVRTYKLAAKNIFLSKENEPHVPNNIRKLIKGPLNPEIIKHVGRVKATSDLPASPSTNFSNHADLTILSSTSASEGIFNISTTSEGDVSLYVSKKAARTNFSTKQ